MSLKKLILLVIFLWHRAESKQLRGFSLHMKNGNFFIDNGNGDVPILDIEKAQSTADLVDQNNSAGKLNIRPSDKSISGVVGNLNEDAAIISETSSQDKIDKIDELCRLIEEYSVAESLHNDDHVYKKNGNIISIENKANIKNRDISSKNHTSSKISDNDLNKIREVLDKEYGKSILLMPKRDLEKCIQIIKVFSNKDWVQNGTKLSSKFDNSNHKFVDEVSSVAECNFTQQNQDIPPATGQKSDAITRKLIMNEFSQLLDRLDLSKSIPSIVQDMFKLNKLKQLEEINSLKKENKIAFINDNCSLLPLEKVKNLIHDNNNDQSSCCFDRQLAKLLSEPCQHHHSRRDIKAPSCGEKTLMPGERHTRADFIR